MDSTRNKTIRGLFWSFTEVTSKQGLQLIIQIILARLLSPEHFGLIGMLLVFIAISNVFIQSGLDQALIREKDITDQDYSTVFYFNLAVSITIYIVLFFSAPLVADFFEEPDLVEILRVLMLTIIFNAFTFIQRVKLVRAVDFKTQTKISVSSMVISGCIAILMAVSGFGVWSLVAQRVIMQFMEAVLLFTNIKWIPSLVFNFSLFKKYFIFGYKLLISGLINALSKNLYIIVIGRMYATAQLGYFTNATKLRDVSSESISQAIQKVTYPILSTFKDNQEMLSSNYQKLIRSTAFLHFPIITMAAALAPLIIPLILGDKWGPSIPFFQLLCVGGLMYPIHALNLNILKVIGRTDIFLRLEIIKVILLLTLLTFAIVFSNSIYDIVLVAVIQPFIALIIHMYVTSKNINYKFLLQARHLSKMFFTSGLLYLSIDYLIEFFQFNRVLEILLTALIGLLVYLILSSIFNRKELKEALSLLKGLKN